MFKLPYKGQTNVSNCIGQSMIDYKQTLTLYFVITRNKNISMADSNKI